MNIHNERWLTRATILTSTRIGIIPFVLYAISYHEWGYAFALFCYASVSDVLDGYCARRWHEETEFGRYLDPVADKLLIGAVCIALAYTGVASMPMWLLVGILSKEFVLIASVIYGGIYAQRFEVKPSLFGKAAMGIQSVFVGMILYTQWTHVPLVHDSLWAAGVCVCVWGALGDYAIRVWQQQS